MKINSINIINLRNHLNSSLEFSPVANIIYGANGTGKTTILEAVSISSISKSFLPTPDALLIEKNSDFYAIKCNAETDFNINYKINVKYEKGARKHISGSEGEHLLPKHIIGIIPIVILSPDFKAITFGAPAERRNFIDRTLSQASRKYYELLVDLKKCLKQRNSLLNDARKSSIFDKISIEAWSEKLINLSAEISIRRYKFIRNFLPYFKKIYSEITNSKEKVDLIYAPDHFENLNERTSLNEAINNYSQVYEKYIGIELKRGSTVFGPQKDELQIIINDGLAKDFASQGQHKSLLISLKFAEFNFLKEIKQETPIILLDDIFSELDIQRSELVLNLLKIHSAQSFITLTNREIVRPEFIGVDSIKYFEINDGKVIS